jgi:predicted secreted protein
MGFGMSSLDKFPGEKEIPPGRGETHLWKIKAVTQGSQQVKGIYKQPWMDTTGTEDNFTLNA